MEENWSLFAPGPIQRKMEARSRLLPKKRVGKGDFVEKMGSYLGRKLGWKVTGISQAPGGLFPRPLYSPQSR